MFGAGLPTGGPRCQSRMPNTPIVVKAKAEASLGYATAERTKNPLAGAERMRNPLAGAERMFGAGWPAVPAV